ncbi:MAG: pilus assembly protein PilO [Rhodocyclaceae bacterium]|nr:pilus assembly protein PilO [Rhodocyclaceae bacterium]
MKKPTLPDVRLPSVDLKQIVEDFKTLDPKDPGLWPVLPRVVILFSVFCMILAAAGWFGWKVQWEELEAKRKDEISLKEKWVGKKKQAINLDEYRRQLAEIDRSFGALLKQLPNKSEMEALLVDINQAGLGRGLQFELFKPGSEARRDFYAELPISIKLTGNYHDLGAFTGDVAKMPRIVTLNDIEVVVGKDSTLVLSSTAKTFRYLDEEELARLKAEQKKQGAKK